MTSFALILGQIFEVPQLFTAGQVLTDNALEAFNEIRADAIHELIEEWTEASVATSRDDIEARIAAIGETYLALRPSRLDDPVFSEALALAREHITLELAKQGLPAPRLIDSHAEAILVGNPDFLFRARQRVEARIAIGRAALAEVEARAGVRR